jgi:hypothetical protein
LEWTGSIELEESGASLELLKVVVGQAPGEDPPLS